MELEEGQPQMQARGRMESNKKMDKKPKKLMMRTKCKVRTSDDGDVEDHLAASSEDDREVAEVKAAKVIAPPSCEETDSSVQRSADNPLEFEEGQPQAEFRGSFVSEKRLNISKELQTATRGYSARREQTLPTQDPSNNKM
eukprot:4613585-Prymnesium_polylepis.1